jgi:hypothetical protein
MGAVAGAQPVSNGATQPSRESLRRDRDQQLKFAHDCRQFAKRAPHEADRQAWIRSMHERMRDARRYHTQSLTVAE